MNLGDIIECAVWYHGPRDRMNSMMLSRSSMASLEQEHDLVLGPITFSDLEPGDARVPDPPKHTKRGVKLLLAEATILAYKPLTPDETSALTELDPVDLNHLRAVTRSAYAKTCPGRPPMTDSDCDQMIARLTPGVAEKILRESINGRRVVA